MAAVGKWATRALIAFATLAAAFWVAGPAAADPTERVLSLVSQEKYSEARAALDPLLRSEPNAPRLRLLHGILRAREGSPREAIAIFERLRNDRPEMFEPYNNLAVLYAERGRLDDAHDVLIAALERKPDAVAYANLGDIYMRLADRAYTHARDIGGGNSPAWRRIRLRPPASAVTAKPAESPAPKSAETATRRSDTRERNTEKKAPPRPSPAAAKPPAPRAKPPAPAAASDGPKAPIEDPGNTRRAEKELAPAGASGSACVQAGKFRDRKALAKAVEWMHSQGAEVLDLRHKKSRVVNSYRVYLPALSNAKEASAKLRELRGRGLRDLAVIRKGARANQISLGVFKSKSNSERRVAQLRKLGYPAERAENSRALSEHAVRARSSGAGAALAAAWGSGFPGQPIEFIDCP